MPALAVAAGCAYLGTARDFDPAAVDREPGWLAVRTVQWEPAGRLTLLVYRKEGGSR